MGDQRKASVPKNAPRGEPLGSVTRIVVAKFGDLQNIRREVVSQLGGSDAGLATV